MQCAWNLSHDTRRRAATRGYVPFVPGGRASDRDVQIQAAAHSANVHIMFLVDQPPPEQAHSTRAPLPRRLSQA